jgi:hypothetical protein
MNTDTEINTLDCPQCDEEITYDSVARHLATCPARYPDNRPGIYHVNTEADE